MMFEYLGRQQAADFIVKGLPAAILKKTVTYDLERLMTGATSGSWSELEREIVENM